MPIKRLALVGGLLLLAFVAAPVPAAMAITITPDGAWTLTGSATITFATMPDLTCHVDATGDIDEDGQNGTAAITFGACSGGFGCSITGINLPHTATNGTAGTVSNATTLPSSTASVVCGVTSCTWRIFTGDASGTLTETPTQSSSGQKGTLTFFGPITDAPGIACTGTIVIDFTVTSPNPIRVML